MTDWSSYSPADFVPFTAQVHFRLLERLNEELWPLPLFALVLGAGVLALFRLGRAAVAFTLLAAAWAWVGYRFLYVEYARLNWAGEYFAWGFWFQALIVVAVAWRARPEALPRARGPEWLGLAIASFGLIVYPLIAVVSGYGWSQAEIVGIHPDPTAVFTLGLLVMAGRGTWAWLALPIPVLWCAVTGITLWVLHAPWWPVPLIAALSGLVAVTWASIARRPAPRRFA